MNQTGKIEQNVNQYITAWAVMMNRIWQDRMLLAKIRPGELFESFTPPIVEMASDGSLTSITHSFKLYGRMVDMGVGSGTNKAEADTPGHRRSRKWYNKSYYISTKRLDEARMELYGEEFQAIIHDTLNF